MDKYFQELNDFYADFMGRPLDLDVEIKSEQVLTNIVFNSALERANKLFQVFCEDDAEDYQPLSAFMILQRDCIELNTQFFLHQYDSDKTNARKNVGNFINDFITLKKDVLDPLHDTLMGIEWFKYLRAREFIENAKYKYDLLHLDYKKCDRLKNLIYSIDDMGDMYKLKEIIELYDDLFEQRVCKIVEIRQQKLNALYELEKVVNQSAKLDSNLKSQFQNARLSIENANEICGIYKIFYLFQEKYFSQ